MGQTCRNGRHIAEDHFSTDRNHLPALYIADRSNLFKIGQPMNNVRVERREMRWGWDPNNTGGKYTALQDATANVMNPLPWESFPNTIPNVSPDYPDVDRSRTTFRGNGIDMSARGITLPQPNTTTTPGRKVLSPLQIDLQLDVPQYQPANINTDYYDITDKLVGDLYAPMQISTGTPVVRRQRRA